MGDVPDALMEKALECGANQNEQGRLCYPTLYSKVPPSLLAPVLPLLKQ